MSKLISKNNVAGILLAFSVGPIAAQDQELNPTQEEEMVSSPAPTEIVSTEENATPDLPQAEHRLRKGIMMLHSLLQTMADIKDKESAEAAVPVIMRYVKEFPAWAQSFNSLPPMEEMEKILYEDRYLPIIENLNKIIKAQAGRLAAAEYYNSNALLTALVHLALINQ